MNRRLVYILVLGGALVAPHRLLAQRDSLLGRDIVLLGQSDAWLTGRNAAALTRMGDVRLSEAEVGMRVGRGGFVNYYESPKTVEASAKVESFYRLDGQIALYGSMDYGGITGREMTGSAFVNPTRMPFDIVEDSLTNNGRKHRDTYRLAGAVGANVGKGVAIGVRVDYIAANYAKYKDLRHKNSLMDMTVVPSVYVPVAGIARLGLGYYYRRNTESVRFGTYGNSDRVYKSLVDYGVFFGKVEAYGENGYTDGSREMPFFSEHKGVTAQLGVDLSGRWSLYGDLMVANRSGYYGKKSPYTISYSQHDSREYDFKGRMAWRKGRNCHAIDVTVGVENLKNHANSYRSTTDKETTASYYEYFVPVKLANKVWATGSVAYTGHYGRVGELPEWTVEAGQRLMRRKQTAYLYPYYRNQELSHVEGYVRLGRNIDLRSGVLGLEASASYLKGHGEPYEDQTFIEPSDVQSPPPTMKAFLMREYRYLTAPQYRVGASARYAFLIPHSGLHMFVRMVANHHKANWTCEEAEGRDHQEFSFSVGCIF